MSRAALPALLLGLALAAGGAEAAGPARAAEPSAPPAALQHPGLHPPLPEAPTAPQRPGELDCRACHQGKHRGVLEMYLGVGGHGTPMIPSHMFQVRVECVACHIAPKETEELRKGLVGQTFRPSEQACVTCHGAKYRGMLQQWTATLERMSAVLTPKLQAARDALAAAAPGHPKLARARKLAADAEANARFVTFAKGVHNVFYAADLLKLANGWLDEAVALLGRTPATGDDELVRGGYCAVLCHKAAGVTQTETVRFRRLTVPHVRHVSEFGATCTSCHSAEMHKAVTATPATCAGCHHGPRNERCEGCHRAQSAFYRGTTPTTLARVAPNLMADAVACTGCHDWSKKPSRAALAEACRACHEPQYTLILPEWTGGLRAEVRRTAEAVGRAEAALARARRGGRKAPEAEALLRRAREALALVRKGGAAHNPLAAAALLAAAREAAAQAAGRAR
ncbi:MAG: hypothetical protein A3D33_03150 [Candidatus Rokubacteria bacterium RIFCSPHIGHO2_02_FULL_73_26]|nr:MAG: hypothetical protein A3D33_03150 [Candidatus Rokubacteria bacterium RIFCSPHIGHO2_02_FULL_73_26]